jgi:hypothetical protein
VIKKMAAVQMSEKSANYSTTTSSASSKTPFGIEDILFINNNNKNIHDKNLVKKIGENNLEFEINKKSER